MTKASMSDEEERREFQKVVMEGLVPKVEDSAYCVSVVPTDETNYLDAKFCVELGVMIMLDKPILALVLPGAKVPAKLALVADEIVEADIKTDEGRAVMQKSMEAFCERFDS